MTNLNSIEVEVLPEGLRRSRRFWAIDPQELFHQEVVGYECPEAPKIWWVPMLGYSLTLGISLFEDEKSCLDVLANQLREQKDQIERSLTDVEFRLRELENDGKSI